ncbi:hypothetical protein V5N11_003329 [Cardamine amara subsp. amara]|uniref:Uncharacterized protein n=1 Tax=Cardamine amara subsp. amara TaxID=228776 RepID=A0ABD1BTT8_CARAN
MSLNDNTDSDSESKFLPRIIQIILLVSSVDLDSKPDSEPLLELISLITQKFPLVNSMHSDLERGSDLELVSLVAETLSLEPVPEVISLIRQIFSIVLSMNSKWSKLISLCPQVQVILKKGKFHVSEQVPWRSNDKWVVFLYTGKSSG